MEVIAIDDEEDEVQDIFKDAGSDSYKNKLNEFAMQSTGRQCSFATLRIRNGIWAAIAAVPQFALLEKDPGHSKKSSVRFNAAHSFCLRVVVSSCCAQHGIIALAMNPTKNLLRCRARCINMFE
jgi:hypothetical protein